MPGKTEKEALDNFIGFIKETLSCISADWLTAFPESGRLYKVWYNPPARLALRSGGHKYLYFTQIFTVGKVPGDARNYKVSTREYSYRLSNSQCIEDDDIIAYHWHPREFEVRYPHLHVRSVKRVHFPTSRVCIEDFARLLIDYYDVKPILSQDKYTEILRKNRRAFSRGATWTVDHS